MSCRKCTPNKKVFEYIQKQVCANKAVRELFCSSPLFCFRELNRFCEISVRDPRKILRVSQNSKLEPRNSMLENRNSSVETRFSKTLRIENRVLSQDRQLTFERYCNHCYGVWQDGFPTMKEAGVQFHEGVPTTFHFQKWFLNGG